MLYTYVTRQLRNCGIGLWTADWLWRHESSARRSLHPNVADTRLSDVQHLIITLARAQLDLQSVALGPTKPSFAFTLLRLMPGGWEAKAIWMLIVIMNLQFAVHVMATWQTICGVPSWSDVLHLESRCWTLKQSITFSVFSALYLVLCDFVLALLLWKLVFSLQMKRSEKLGVAIALSIGILAGITEL
ncbi:uncharacterized protein BCR38DRAFT_489040 [Pseudomassariella vexata]|uniref:Rhodopsin domain-containing protein n=1 Tax=Pseudomassariella vexata TaxID=1141098 RepID=A0A1Y2DJ99_9PEZI|nr:uncharacterized protein BCR38DRAFT_489040 [Pseudomassariella vexata]ORY59307.1 hypothetical protein BCR38DRAFT_489040 [Pseudomassariella vexata]